MILKQRFEDTWIFTDHITEIQTRLPHANEFDDTEHIRIVVRYCVDEHSVTIPLYDSAYLLNDDGGTIERLVP